MKRERARNKKRRRKETGVVAATLRWKKRGKKYKSKHNFRLKESGE